MRCSPFELIREVAPIAPPIKKNGALFMKLWLPSWGLLFLHSFPIPLILLELIPLPLCFKTFLKALPPAQNMWNIFSCHLNDMTGIAKKDKKKFCHLEGTGGQYIRKHVGFESSRVVEDYLVVHIKQK